MNPVKEALKRGKVRRVPGFFSTNRKMRKPKSSKGLLTTRIANLIT